MRKVDDGEKKRKKKRMLFLMAITSLPAVDRPNADRWNAARLCQNEYGYKQSKGGLKKYDSLQRKADFLNVFIVPFPK